MPIRTKSFLACIVAMALSRFKQRCGCSTKSLRAFLSLIFAALCCGSGSEDIARGIGAPFIQEVVAGATAVRALYPQANCTIELGGQDAKMIFFRHDESGVQELGDMRMNGSCAGGTGAFIDEVAEVLSIPVEQFNEYAEAGTRTYDISGRCGVYAKTDIQPL